MLCTTHGVYIVNCLRIIISPRRQQNAVGLSLLIERRMSVSLSKPTQPAAIATDRASRNPVSGDAEPVATLLSEAQPIALTRERLLAAEAMRLLMRLDSELLGARAQWNQDWFRRVMRSRSKAASRLRRRWGKIIPPPAIPLGSLRRRYHANLARYLH